MDRKDVVHTHNRILLTYKKIIKYSDPDWSLFRDGMCYSVVTTSRSFFFHIPQIQMICHRGRRDFSSLMLKNICTVLR